MGELKIETEVYSRCSGYFRPVKQWNNGKREEFSERRKMQFNLTPEKELPEVRMNPVIPAQIAQ